MTPKKTALIILDGWGIGELSIESNAIFAAHTPCMDELMKVCANATLRTDGSHVGLPEGQMGNSEVGHMNIGAGRIVYQDLLRIDRAIASGEFAQNETLKKACMRAKDAGCRLHLMGLVSKGGVHSQQAHLHELVDVVQGFGLNDVFVHAFTDGRDTAPQTVCLPEGLGGPPAGTSARGVGARSILRHGPRFPLGASSTQLRSLAGTDRAILALSSGIQASYDEGITDEFIVPFAVEGVDGSIRPGDVVICFNFRTDRCREITMALTQQAFPEHGMEPLALHYVTMTNYDDSFKASR